APRAAHLVMFQQAGATRLGWYVFLTLPNYQDQSAVIVAADRPDGEVLYSRSTARHAAARGRVFEFAPKDDPSGHPTDSRKVIDFPRPVGDYPAMPNSPLTGFPFDWVETDSVLGNPTP